MGLTGLNIGGRATRGAVSLYMQVRCARIELHYMYDIGQGELGQVQARKSLNCYVTID